MEQYGIYYYFKHSDGDHKLVLSDSRSAHDPVQAATEPSFKGGGGRLSVRAEGQPPAAQPDRASDALVDDAPAADRQVRAERL